MAQTYLTVTRFTRCLLVQVWAKPLDSLSRKASIAHTHNTYFPNEWIYSLLTLVHSFIYSFLHNKRKARLTQQYLQRHKNFDGGKITKRDREIRSGRNSTRKSSHSKYGALFYKSHILCKKQIMFLTCRYNFYIVC